MQRVVIIGTSGSGKSTLAQALARRLDAEFVELDGLHFLPDWEEVSSEVFRQRVSAAIDAEGWVVAGNYADVRDLIWMRADTLIWLDYPLPLVFWRLFRRTIQRIVHHEDLWGTGNRETWRIQFLSRHSVFLWLLKTHASYPERIEGLLRQPENAHLRVLRFKSPNETKRWLQNLDGKG